MRKKIALLLSLLMLVSGLIAIEPVFTQISPPVPSFTLKLEDDSHDVTNATGTYHISIKVHRRCRKQHWGTIQLRSRKRNPR